MSHKLESTAMARREDGLPVVRSLDLLKATCKALNLKEPEWAENVSLGTGRATGWSVRLPGWTCPCVFDIEKGDIAFDNYSIYDHNHAEVKAGRRRVGEEGQWGDFQKMLDFEQEYLSQAIQTGRRVWEEEMMAVGGVVHVESETKDQLVLRCSQ